MDFKAFIFIGLACIFIPLVCLGLAYVSVEWTTVAQEVTYPILAVAVLGICFIALFSYLKR